MQKYLDNKQSQYCLITNNQVVSQNAIKLPSLPHSDTALIHSFLYSIRVPIPASLYTNWRQNSVSKKGLLV